jgi:hypothetical protein
MFNLKLEKINKRIYKEEREGAIKVNFQEHATLSQHPIINIGNLAYFYHYTRHINFSFVFPFILGILSKEKVLNYLKIASLNTRNCGHIKQ